MIVPLSHDRPERYQGKNRNWLDAARHTPGLHASCGLYLDGAAPRPFRATSDGALSPSPMPQSHPFDMLAPSVYSLHLAYKSTDCARLGHSKSQECTEMAAPLLHPGSRAGSSGSTSLRRRLRYSGWVVEDADTFAGSARKKASELARRSHGSSPTIRG